MTTTHPPTIPASALALTRASSRSPHRRTVGRRALGAAALAAALTGATAGTVLVPTMAAADRDGVLNPVTECVVVNGDGSFTAFFGYEHRGADLVEVSRGDHNRVSGARGDSPTSFTPGRQVAVFSATTRGAAITWRLGERETTATPESQPCSTNPSVPEAPVTVLLLLAPALITGWWMRRRERLAFG